MSRSRKEKGHYGSSWNRMRAEKLAGTPQCYLCGEAIDTSLDWRHPGAPQLHLIIPITKGGSWRDPNNARATHRICNLRQSNHDDGTIDHGRPLSQQGWVIAETP